MEEGAICSMCHQFKRSADYRKTEWNKSRDRKCKECRSELNKKKRELKRKMETDASLPPKKLPATGNRKMETDVSFLPKKTKFHKEANESVCKVCKDVFSTKDHGLYCLYCHRMIDVIKKKHVILGNLINASFGQ